MRQQGEIPLIIDLSGPGWKARLDVAEPGPQPPRRVEFSVAWTGQTITRRVVAEVRYTTATDHLPSKRPHWHVKIYRCATDEDTVALRTFLRKQAHDIQKANAVLPGPPRGPLDPPWAVVPVQIVRGDGAPENYGGTRTELGAPVEPDASRRLRPAWFAVDDATAERTLLAVSPTIEEIAWPSLTYAPATHHLRAFEAMATGLDILHSKGVIHSDIKPANVCRFHTVNGYGYVLIDADAATRLSPAPVTLRWTDPYVHAGVLDWAQQKHQRGKALAAGTLLAHDRFCFALVVLSAITGVDWVKANLLIPDDLEESAERPADRHADVVAALGRLWPESVGEPSRARLIQALAAPFKAGALLDGWSAREWVAQVSNAEFTEASDEVGLRARAWHSAALEEIRLQVSPRALRSEVVGLTIAAIHRKGQEVAWQAARGWLLGAAGLITVVASLIAIGAVGMGK